VPTKRAPQKGIHHRTRLDVVAASRRRGVAASRRRGVAASRRRGVA
jgi:hypothetical protein